MLLISQKILPMVSLSMSTNQDRLSAHTCQGRPFYRRQLPKMAAFLLPLLPFPQLCLLLLPLSL